MEITIVYNNRFLNLELHENSTFNFKLNSYSFLYPPQLTNWQTSSFKVTNIIDFLYHLSDQIYSFRHYTSIYAKHDLTSDHNLVLLKLDTTSPSLVYWSLSKTAGRQSWPDVTFENSRGNR